MEHNRARLKILPVIMCGGNGTRLWPESRESLPKQFIPFFGSHSTFQMTVDMLTHDLFEAPIVIANCSHRFLVFEQLKEIGRSAEIILEPVQRDSGPAVGVAAQLASQRARDAIVGVFAADHVIENRDGFIDACQAAGRAAGEGFIVTLGIKPSEPATGYGYIKRGEPVLEDSEVRRVVAFVEKPDLATAEQYVADDYVWNAGNFIFRADVMQDELSQWAPKIYRSSADAINKSISDLDFVVLDKNALLQAPKVSIDYALMEHTQRAAVVAANFGWSDVGNWGAVHELSTRDDHGNAVRGHGLIVDASNVYIRSDEQLTTVLGVNDVIVVTTSDAVLVLDGKQCNKVKHLVETLKTSNRREAIEHRRSHRPWGYYQSVDEGSRYQVKRIVVKPGARLSLQKHFHRAEHWIVVRGTAEVTRNNEITLIHENESIYLPIGSVHRMANPGRIDLELIEVQTGSYLGEDDIIRFEDAYNRL
jgi:mannose-1-phosphate guanylyltransferase / mannose-6-phosphate isomerase